MSENRMALVMLFLTLMVLVVIGTVVVWIEC